MRKEILVAFGIIILFLILFITPSVAVYNVKNNENNLKVDNEAKSTSAIDWWPMYHHDLQNTRFSTSSAPVTNEYLWICELVDGYASSSPIIVDNKVYFGAHFFDSNTTLYCLNAETGDLIWRYYTEDWQEIESTPAVAYGKVYFGSNNGNIYCLNAETGDFIWSYDTGTKCGSSPAILDGYVYIGSAQDGKLFCLDADNGKVYWSYYVGSSVLSTPAVVDGKVYFGCHNGYIYCLDAETGDSIWMFSTSDWVHSSPAVINGNVYIGSHNKYLYCRNADTGENIWSYKTGDTVDSTPAIAYGYVYFGSMDYKVYCLDAVNGDFIWSYTTDFHVESSPAVADGKVYIGSLDNRIYCLDAYTGKYIWHHYTTRMISSSPAIANGCVYVCAGEFIYCFGRSSQMPDAPTLTGPKSGKAGTEYEYIFNAEDPNGDDVKYHIDWGDGNTETTEFYSSGTDATVNHTWIKMGLYLIKARAENTNGLLGPEGKLIITMPRTRLSSYLWFEWLLDCFPLLERLLLFVR